MTSSTNKVLVLFTTTWTGNNGQRGSFRIRRGSTDIGVGDARGSRTRAFYGYLQTRSTNQCMPLAGQILDTPGAGTHTYKVQIRCSRNSNFYWNMNQASNLGNYSAQTCSMTLQEISA